MISVKNVSKEFQKIDNHQKKVKFLADDAISFEAKEGEIVGILGPNGAGKTTLLRMLAGIMTPTSGEILIDGKSYTSDGITIKKEISFLSGNTHLYKDISAYELFTMCGEYYHMESSKIKEQISVVTKELGLEDFLYQRIGSLSTGQLQRVNIARCLLHEPKYYILDEATSGLDVLSSKVILDFIKSEKTKNKCILYSTHYMEEAENICDRVILIHRGKVICTGKPSEICKDTNTTNLRDAFFVLIGGEVHEA